VAVLIHGNHPTCPTDTGGGTWPCPAGTEQPNHEGLGYLAEALATRGFVTIAPGVNVQYTFGFGEPAAAVRTAEIVDRALTALGDGELGVDPAMVDISHVVMVGHSVGAQDAGILAAGRVDVGHPVTGVVMLQPALNDGAALPLVDVPSVVVLSECDGDTGLRGGDYVATALLEGRQTPAALIVLERANHNFTNTLLAPDVFPVMAPACDDGNRLPADVQQDLLADTVPELAHAVLGEGTGAGWAGAVFDGPETPDGVLLDLLLAGEPVAPVPGPGPGIPEAVEADGMTLTFCPEGYYTPFVEPGTEPCHRPDLPMMVGYPRTIAASWDEVGAAITLAVDAAPGDIARLRLLPDVADDRLTSPLQVRLSVPGGVSTEVSIELPEVRRERIDPFDIAHAFAMWSTVTLELPDGAEQMRVEVLGPDEGSIQIVSLGTHPEP
jgi:dienelactone hydrolase